MIKDIESTLNQSGFSNLGANSIIRTINFAKRSFMSGILCGKYVECSMNSGLD